MKVRDPKLNLVPAILILLSGLGASPARAAGAPLYQGDFQLHPKVMHNDPITGKMSLIYDGDVLKDVRLMLDQPVFGYSNLGSSDRWATAVSTATADAQTVVAFRLQGPPHAWYFVAVVTSPDGGVTLNGTLYRADTKLKDIQKTAQAAIQSTPTKWTAIGSVTLKKQ
jgi:hypothetical protein